MTLKVQVTNTSDKGELLIIEDTFFTEGGNMQVKVADVQPSKTWSGAIEYHKHLTLRSATIMDIDSDIAD